jgi:hypothetical protein
MKKLFTVTLFLASTLLADVKTIELKTGPNKNAWYVVENPDPNFFGSPTTLNGALTYRATAVMTALNDYPYVDPNTGASVWSLPSALSGWVSNRTYPAGPAPCAEPYLWCQGSAKGLYKYVVYFTVPTAVTGSVRVRGRWMTDGIGSALELNGVVYSGTGYSSAAYNRWQSFYLPTGGKVGLNSLVVHVANSGGPHGFRVEAIVEYDPK